MEQKTLNLTLKKKWFNMISSGEKKEEYREIKPYWASRLLCFREQLEYGVFEEMLEDMQHPFHRHSGPTSLMEYFRVSFRKFDVVRFKNGYSKDAPVFTLPLKSIRIAHGQGDWGAEGDRYYFVIQLGDWALGVVEDSN